MDGSLVGEGGPAGLPLDRDLTLQGINIDFETQQHKVKAGGGLPRRESPRGTHCRLIPGHTSVYMHIEYTCMHDNNDIMLNYKYMTCLPR